MTEEDLTGKGAEQRKAIAEAYKEICENIRVTDEISFKLLGAVPTAATIGAGTLTLLDKTYLAQGGPHGSLGIIAISALGAFITFGLFRWELRNIQKCNWLIERAAQMERFLYPKDSSGFQYRGMASKDGNYAGRMSDVPISSLLKRPWGKTQSEKVIYLAAITMWLVPVGVALHRMVA